MKNLLKNFYKYPLNFFLNEQQIITKIAVLVLNGYFRYKN